MGFYLFFICVLSASLGAHIVGMDIYEQRDRENLDLITLFLAAKAGDTAFVMATLTEKPELLNKKIYQSGTDIDGHTVVTIAATAKQIHLLTQLMRHAPQISHADYICLWAELTKTPQDAAARYAMALITLCRSSSFSFYKKTLENINSHAEYRSRLAEYLNPPTALWQKRVSATCAKIFSLPVISHISAAAVWTWRKYIPYEYKLPTLLCTAALHHDNLLVEHLLCTYGSEIPLESYYRAASYACYAQDNPHLALYILCLAILRNPSHILNKFALGMADACLQASKNFVIA